MKNLPNLKLKLEVLDKEPEPVNQSLILSNSSKRTPRENALQSTYQANGPSTQRDRLNQLSYRNNFMSTLTSVKPAIDLTHFKEQGAAANGSARLRLSKMEAEKNRF